VNAAIAAGNRAILVSAGPAGDKSPGHPDFDPMWARLSETKTPFMLHIGPGTKTQPKAFQNNGRARSPDLHGGGENLRFCDYIMLSFAPQVWLTAMVYDGVFERFPELRGGAIESGAGWAPEFLRELDLGYKSFGRTDPYLQAMPMKPPSTFGARSNSRHSRAKMSAEDLAMAAPTSSCFRAIIRIPREPTTRKALRAHHRRTRRRHPRSVLPAELRGDDVDPLSPPTPTTTACKNTSTTQRRGVHQTTLCDRERLLCPCGTDRRYLHRAVRHWHPQSCHPYLRRPMPRRR
jgi:hypothetical protein